MEHEVREKTDKLLSIGGSRSVDSFHRELGLTMWDKCGMARSESGLREAVDKIRGIRESFWGDVRVLGESENLNQSLEKAGRVADFLEFAETFAVDALHRSESCGGHFREESQTEEGEALRDDENFCYAAAWEFQGVGNDSTLHKEDLSFDYVKLAQRSYK